MRPLLPPVIPEGHPGLGRFPEVLVLKGVLEGSITITLEANEPAKAIDISLIFSFVIPAKAGIHGLISPPYSPCRPSFSSVELGNPEYLFPRLSFPRMRESRVDL